MRAAREVSSGDVDAVTARRVDTAQYDKLGLRTGLTKCAGAAREGRAICADALCRIGD